MTNHAFIPAKEMIFSRVEGDIKRLADYCRSLDENAPLRLDLSSVNQCDSAGLAFLIEAKRLASLNGRLLEIHGMTKNIHALAEFCGVDGILSFN